MAIKKIPILSKRCKDLTRQRFGHLIVLGPTKKRKGRKVVWLCVCDCGNVREVASNNLGSGNTKSCGCSRGKANTIHGMAGTSIYRTWQDIIKRCENPKHSAYKYYGGRGIKICKYWRNSFEAFYADVGDRPEGMTLDRWPNNNGDYEPNNWRWATWKEQANNTRKLCWFRVWHKDSMAQYLSNNQSEFAKKWGLNSSNISKCLRGKQKVHKGWQFQKIELGSSF